MGRRLVRFCGPAASEAAFGWLEDGAIRPIGGSPRTLGELVAGDGLVTAAAGAPTLPGDQVRLEGPLTPPARVFCLGLNYAPHREETGHRPERPDEMLYFLKSDGSFTGPRGPIVRPEGVRLLDYEVELGLVIGRGVPQGSHVDQDLLHDVVAGWIACNDVSARDQQFGGAFMQWTASKSHPTFLPNGPWVFVPDDDERARIRDLVVECRVNGELRQRASTADFLFAPHEAVERLARQFTLRPGDVVLTGTPGGVALTIAEQTRTLLADHLFDDPARRAALVEDQWARGGYLRPDDVVTVSIRSADGVVDLGTQECRVVESS